MSADARKILEVCEATWPPARVWQAGTITLRDGAGGGKRVSAATANGPVNADDLDSAEAQMRAMGHRPLFQISNDDQLDALLAARGYTRFDEVVLYTLPITELMDKPIPRVTAFTVWEPLAIMTEIWAGGGIDRARLDVMDRVKLKTGILSRWNEKPAGVAFAGVHDGVCMVHAVEIVLAQRRQGVAQWIMRAAAQWGHAQGANEISVLCVKDNEPANALYRALGFAEVGRYHYRIADK